MRMLIGGLMIALLNAPPASTSAPVLVELFTSQGCSSCPPAESLLSGWGRESFRKGEIIPLAFHVDYWDELGWPDPFSSPAFTRRQNEYARAFRSASVYTPQMVVNGRTDFTGSDLARARREVEKSIPLPANGSLRVELGRNADGKIRLEIFARPESRAARLYCAVFENGLVTEVRRGENRGKTLTEDFVVRDFRKLADLPARTSYDQTIQLNWNPDWDPKKCGAAVFLQEEENAVIATARSVFPLKP
jgi:hypothetical protein